MFKKATMIISFLLITLLVLACNLFLANAMFSRGIALLFAVFCFLIAIFGLVVADRSYYHDTRRFSLENLSSRAHSWPYFDPFYILPTIQVSTSINDEDDAYKYTRWVDVLFLWFIVGLGFKFGRKI